MPSDSSSSSYSSSDEEVKKNLSSNSSDSDVEPKQKKSKKVKKGVKKEKIEDDIWEKTDDGGFRTKIGPNKHVSLRTFKGKTYVDIREFYEKDGKQMPGISLNVETWNNFKVISDEISAKLSKM